MVALCNNFENRGTVLPNLRITRKVLYREIFRSVSEECAGGCMPYGEKFVQEGDTGFQPKFNSQELDEETNFYFYNARFYDPQIARFVSADTVIDGEYDTQGWNRYMYVKGNPIIGKDPTGHKIEVDAETKTINFTARISDDGNSKGNKFSKEELEVLASDIVKSMKESYGVQDNGTQWKVNIDIDTEYSETEIGDRHTIILTNDMKDDDGVPASGSAVMRGMGFKINRSLTIASSLSKIDLIRSGATVTKDMEKEFGAFGNTGAHEFGHSAGLYHEYGVNNKDNLLYPTSDYDRNKVTQSQLQEMASEYSSGNLNNPNVSKLVQFKDAMINKAKWLESKLYESK